MSIIVIGVDPGLSAGVAETVDGHRGAVFQGKPEDAQAVLRELVSRHAGDTDHRITVACERYVQAGRQAISHQPEAQQMIGVVKDTTTAFGVRLELQMPADAHRIASDEFLRRCGLWVQPRELNQPDADDARMALRHAVLALSRRHARLFGSLMDRNQG